MISKPESCAKCFGACWGMSGFVPASGSGDNGVLILGEAAGESEASEGVGFCGKAGFYLFQNLQRAGIEREGFRIDNILKCRPPKNLLTGMSYEDQVIKSCKPLLAETIVDMQERCRKNGKHFTILCLGKIPFKAVMGYSDKDPIMRKDYIAYPFFNPEYKAWVVPAYHPSYMMRGNTHLVPVLQFAATRALEIANDGLRYSTPSYTLDPETKVFSDWVANFLKAQEKDPSLILSYDIETPFKQGSDEEEVSREDDDDYTILRCSFAYKPEEAVSIPWNAEHKAALEELFKHAKTLCGWNSAGYDRPRVQAQMQVNGDELDGMLMWHVLNSALPKGLGFVAPFYVPNIPVWKYMSDSEPAKYNAIDADVALQCVLGIRRDLERENLWSVFSRHVVEVHKVFNYMSGRGVLIDKALRQEAETKLVAILKDIEEKMEGAVPKDAKKLKVYKKKPKREIPDLFELTQDLPVKYCEVCGLQSPTRWKKHSTLCGGAITMLPEPQQVWGKYEEFKVSKKSLQSYQRSLTHQAMRSRKEGKVTFDEKAIIQLIKKYPKDALYPLILEHRGAQKLLGTYVGTTLPTGIVRGGLPTGPDGRVHCVFTSNPSTLRSACQAPNLQNQPRPKGPDDPATIIRNLFIAAEGQILTARDFSGIEAKLVGYFAGDPDYMRLCSIDVHSFYTAYAINALDGRIKSYDLPQLGWSDTRLTEHLAGIKKEYKSDRNNLYKHLVHAINFGQKARGAQEKILQETGIAFPVKMIEKVMDLYKELFPKIPKWQWNALLQVEANGYLRNPFGYVHRFTRPFEYEKIGGKWSRKPGIDCNKIWAFLPQSTAAGIIKEAMLRLYFDRFDDAGQYLRLLIHDELFLECPEGLVESVDGIVQVEMERPIEQMPLPASFNMGDYLVIGTEAKRGMKWGMMR